jgi:tryptophan synthase alpha chain
MPLSFDKKPALVAYVTCGDPDLATTFDVVMAAVEAGAGVIELGVPFSDPVGDGPVIQRASERALRNHVKLQDVLDLAAKVRRRTTAGLVIFSYLNPILKMGLEQFARTAQKSGVDGALITDLPVEESTEYQEVMKRNGLATIFLAAPTSTDQRLRLIARASSGFVYAVSRTGVTGASQQLPEDAKALVRRLRKFTKLPIAVGFGISNAQQFSAVAQFADAGVIGSAIVATIEQNRGAEARSVAKFIQQLFGAARLPDQP